MHISISNVTIHLVTQAKLKKKSRYPWCLLLVLPLNYIFKLIFSLFLPYSQPIAIAPPLHSLLQSIFHTTPRVVFWKHIGYITPYFKTFQLLPILLIISTCLPMAYRALYDLTSSCTHALLTILKLYHLHFTPQKHQMYSHLRASVPDVPSASNTSRPGSSHDWFLIIQVSAQMSPP